MANRYFKACGKIVAMKGLREVRILPKGESYGRFPRELDTIILRYKDGTELSLYVPGDQDTQKIFDRLWDFL